MTSLRDDLDAAFWPLWRRWQFDVKRFASELLDAMEAIAAKHQVPAPDAGSGQAAEPVRLTEVPAKPAPRRRTRT